MEIEYYINKLENIRPVWKDYKDTDPKEIFAGLTEIKKELLSEGVCGSSIAYTRRDVEAVIAKFNHTRGRLITELTSARKNIGLVVNMYVWDRDSVIPGKIPQTYSMVLFRLSSGTEISEILGIIDYVETIVDDLLSPEQHLVLYTSEFFLLWCSLMAEDNYILSSWEYIHDRQRRRKADLDYFRFIDLKSVFEIVDARLDRGEAIKDRIRPFVGKICYYLDQMSPEKIRKYLPRWACSKILRMIRSNPPRQDMEIDKILKIIDYIS